MSIYTPEIATAFGALDSTAFAAGASFHAHLLRALAMSTNRLTSKGQPVLNLVWPTRAVDTEATSTGAFEGVARPWWERITPSIMFPKRPGLRFATLKVRAKITSGATIWIAAACGGVPRDRLSSADPHVVECLGTGSYADYSLANVPVGEGDVDHVTFFMIGDKVQKAQTGTFGSPTDGAIATLTDQYLGVSGATWNPTTGWPTNMDFGHAGCTIVFTTAGGVSVSTPRIITSNGTATLYFAPPLSQPEYYQALAGGYFQIWEQPVWSIANLAMACEARTT